MGTYVAEKRTLFLYRTTPMRTSQGNEAMCWASALESWLDVCVREFGEKEGTWTGGHHDGLPWNRKRLTPRDMKNLWGDLTSSNKSLDPAGVPVVALDVGMDIDLIRPSKLDANYVRAKLSLFGCLYVIYFSFHMDHAIVVYGIDGEDLLVMDPNPERGLIRRPLGFFKEPNRVNRPMAIGWPVRN